MLTFVDTSRNDWTSWMRSASSSATAPPTWSYATGSGGDSSPRSGSRTVDGGLSH